MTAIISPKVNKRLPQFVETADIKTLLGSVDFPDTWAGKTDRIILQLLYNTGMRQAELVGLKENSLQGDSKIVYIMDHLGIKSSFNSEGVLLQKQPVKGFKSWDFTHCPDLAQTVAVTCAILGQDAVFTGLESLRIKETDRIYALQQELAKFNADLKEIEPEVFKIIPSVTMPQKVQIHTYEDHRMAMAFMPLVTWFVAPC